MKDFELRGQADAACGQPPYAFAYFYGVLGGAVAVFLWAFRHFLGGPPGSVFFIYWLELVALLGAVVLGTASGARYLAWFMAVLAVFLLLGAGSMLAWFAVLPVTVMILVLVATRTGMRLGKRDMCVIAIAGILAIGLGFVYFLMVNGLRYANVLLPERVLSGLAYPDSLYHTALSATIANYGPPASALDGLHPVHYHIFSHLWFGLAAKGVGLNAVHGYYLGIQILALPLLLFGLSFAASACSTIRSDRAGAALLIAAPIAILFVFDYFDRNSYLASESMLVGLVLFLLGIPLLRSIAMGTGKHPDVSAALALIYAILLSSAKISIGIIWTVPLILLLIRGRRLSVSGYCVAVFLLVLHAYVAWAYVIPNDNVATTRFSPFDFFKAYPTLAAANVLLILVAVVFHIRDLRRGQDRLWNEASLLILLLSVMPALLLYMEGGAVYYFLNVGTWLAIVHLSGRLISAIDIRHAPHALVAAVGVIVVAIVLTPQKLRAYGSIKADRQTLYERLDPVSAAKLTHINLFNPTGLMALKDEAAGSTGARIGVLLEKLGARPGSDTLVEVSPNFHAFWTLTRQCNAAPFLIPAFFGLPLLKGLPPAAEHCDLGNYYGYSLYGPSSRAITLDDASLCQSAVQKGFHHVVVVDSADEARMTNCSVKNVLQK